MDPERTIFGLNRRGFTVAAAKKSHGVDLVCVNRKRQVR
jgi:hypothetical protein